MSQWATVSQNISLMAELASVDWCIIIMSQWAPVSQIVSLTVELAPISNASILCLSKRESQISV